MRDPVTFEYAVLRIVPHVEREEFLNAGVILFCKQRDFLATKHDRQLRRLQAFAPQANVAMISEHLDAVVDICEGNPAAGYFSKLSKSERFNWLVAPSSTIIQASKVHTGICIRPPAEILEELYALFVS